MNAELMKFMLYFILLLRC